MLRKTHPASKSSFRFILKIFLLLYISLYYQTIPFRLRPERKRLNMQFEVISEHTENVLNLMMDKAIRENDPAYVHLADTWYTMAEGALFLWQELADACTDISPEEKNKIAARLHSVIDINRYDAEQER
jgi:hypothetical protein